MDDAQENVKRTSARGAKPPDDAVLTTANRGTSGSGRSVTASGRVAPTTKPSGSGVQRAPSGSGIHRAAPPAPPPPAPAPVHAASSRRGQAPVVKKKKPPLPVKELLIAGGLVVLLTGVAIVVYVVKSGKRNEVNGYIIHQQEIFDNNIKLGKDAMDKAAKAGTLFVVGKTEAGFDEKSLFASFKDDPKIYNVIYDHGYKDKRPGEKHDIKKLFDDPEHYTISSLNKTKDYPPDLSVAYGFAQGKAIPVVVAKKTVKPNQGDVVNTGGVIIVVVKAEEDDFFKRARDVELPKVE